MKIVFWGIVVLVLIFTKGCIGIDETCSGEYSFISLSSEITKSSTIKSIGDTLWIERSDTLKSKDDLFVYFNPIFKPVDSCYINEELSGVRLFPYNESIFLDNDTIIDIKFYLIDEKDTIILSTLPIALNYKDYIFTDEVNTFNSSSTISFYRELYNDYMISGGDFYLIIFEEGIYSLELPTNIFQGKSVRFCSEIIFKEKGKYIDSHQYYLADD